MSLLWHANGKKAILQIIHCVAGLVDDTSHYPRVTVLARSEYCTVSRDGDGLTAACKH